MKKLQALADDRQSGAAEITERAAALVEEFCRRQPPGNRRTKEALGKLAETTLTIHPSMAPLLNLANRIQLAAEQHNPSLAGLRRDLAQCRRRQRKASGKIARRFAARIPRRAVVLTYSYSSTILAALLAARRRLQRVIVSEGRPGCEGRTLAKQLASYRIRVTLVVDSALGEQVKHAQAVVVGADAVWRDSYVNKIGTRLLQQEARHRRKRFFVLADTSKLLPPALARFHRLENQPAGAVWQRAPNRVDVINPVFETVPLERWVTLLTERGPLTPRQVRAWLKRQPVARRWRTPSRRKP